MRGGNILLPPRAIFLLYVGFCISGGAKVFAAFLTLQQIFFATSAKKVHILRPLMPLFFIWFVYFFS